MAQTPEGKVKTAIRRVLAQAREQDGWWPVPSGYGENWLDYQGLHRGLFFAIEAKAPGGELSARQRQVIARIERAGGKVFVIDGTEKYPMQPLTDWLNRSDL